MLGRLSKRSLHNAILAIVQMLVDDDDVHVELDYENTKKGSYAKKKNTLLPLFFFSFLITRVSSRVKVTRSVLLCSQPWYRRYFHA
jgi:hypothetical protein